VLARPEVRPRQTVWRVDLDGVHDPSLPAQRSTLPPRPP
jgi:hypothetical protein